jgi:hypothetical protein
MNLSKILDNVLENKKHKLIGTHTYFHFCDVLNRSFKKVSFFKFRFEKYEDYWKGDYSISGLYDTHTDTRYIIFNFPSSCKKFKLDNHFWEDFKFYVLQVCQHEAIHEMQHKKRGNVFEYDEVVEFRQKIQEDSNEMEYLMDTDEIDAYAHDIALEIRYFYPRKNPYRVLTNINSHRKLDSYNYYKKTFKDVDWLLVRKRLLKRVYKWLPTIP